MVLAGGEDVRNGCDGTDPRDLAFQGQQFPFTLSGRSEVPCGEVEGDESQHVEEVLTLVCREGKLGRGPLGRGEKMQERAGCWEHLARTQLCFSPQGVCWEMQGHQSMPSLVPPLLLLSSETPATSVQLF